MFDVSSKSTTILENSHAGKNKPIRTFINLKECNCKLSAWHVKVMHTSFDQDTRLNKIMCDMKTTQRNVQHKYSTEAQMNIL